jgi:uncharacterized protein (TIRG00374 family)
VAVGIITSLVLLVALRWLQILKLIGHPISFFDSCRIVYIGLFFNQCLPSGIGGDVVRVWATTRLGVPGRPAFVSVAADRLFALAAVSIFILGAMPFLLVGPASLIGGMLSAASVLGFAMLLVFDHGLEFIERRPIAAHARSAQFLTGASHCWKVQPVDPMRFLNSAAVRYWVQNGMA